MSDKLGYGDILWLKDRVEQLQAEVEALRGELEQYQTMHTLEDWHEDYGDALWWTLPIEEPPYCGNPLCSDWPGYHTHWTRIVEPKVRKEDTNA